MKIENIKEIELIANREKRTIESIVNMLIRDGLNCYYDKQLEDYKDRLILEDIENDNNSQVQM